MSEFISELSPATRIAGLITATSSQRLPQSRVQVNGIRRSVAGSLISPLLGPSGRLHCTRTRAERKVLPQDQNRSFFSHPSSAQRTMDAPRFGVLK